MASPTPHSETRSMERASRQAAIAVLLVLSAGCSSSAAASRSVLGPSEGTTVTAAPSTATATVGPSALPTQPPRTLTFVLQPYGLAPNQPFLTPGTVVIDIAGGGYTFTVSVSGLVPGSPHKLDIHAGSCAVPNGDFTSILVTQFPADTAGNLVFSKHFARAWVVPTSGQFQGRLLSVHLGGDAGASPTLDCVDLTN